MSRTASLLLAALLGLSAQAQAFDSSDPFGMYTPTEKPAKAPREKNDGRWLEYSFKAWGAGAAAGVVTNVAVGPAVALSPLVAAPVVALIGASLYERQTAEITSFYAGTVVRGKVRTVEQSPTPTDFGGYGLSSIRIVPGSKFGFDVQSFPVGMQNLFDVVHMTIEIGAEPIFAVVRKDSGLAVGDIIDVSIPVGVFAFNTKFLDKPQFDFNKHMPRVVNVYCKHDNPACQNDYDSSLGVIARPNLTEFPPSQYLIDPAIIAADQAKMRKEEDEKKAARNSGGFSFL